MRHRHHPQQLGCWQSPGSHARGRENLTSWLPSPARTQGAGAAPAEGETRGPTNLPHKPQSLQANQTPGTKQPTGLKVRVALGDKQALPPGWALSLKQSPERAQRGHPRLGWLRSGPATRGYLTLTYFRIFFTRDMHRIVTQMDTTEPKKSQYCSVS